ncbi:hypothetical protein [Kordia aestuariivivens]|nr:hypothetical protein [Kordia aestuariivivens]
MKKKNLKSFKLKKELVSSLDSKKRNSIKGGSYSCYYGSRCCHVH